MDGTPDYGRLLDAETRAFVARAEGFFPADAADRPITEQRRLYDAMCRAFHAGRPEGVAAQEGTIAGTRVRRYRGPQVAGRVIWLHGGSLMLGGLESHDDVCAELCARTGLEVIAVDYRLAPEHPAPAAVEDALAVWRAAADAEDGRIVLAGDSAGGLLAAAVCHATRGEARRPDGQVLVYPGLGGGLDAGSGRRHARAPLHPDFIRLGHCEVQLQSLDLVQQFAGGRHRGSGEIGRGLGMGGVAENTRANIEAVGLGMVAGGQDQSGGPVRD